MKISGGVYSNFVAWERRGSPLEVSRGVRLGLGVKFGVKCLFKKICQRIKDLRRPEIDGRHFKIITVTI